MRKIANQLLDLSEEESELEAKFWHTSVSRKYRLDDLAMQKHSTPVDSFDPQYDDHAAHCWSLLLLFVDPSIT